MKIFKKAKVGAKVLKDKTIKRAPELLIGGSILGYAATLIFGCIAAVKIKTALDEQEDALIVTAKKVGDVKQDGTPYNAADMDFEQKQIRKVTRKKIVKAVIVPSALLGTSVTMELAGFHIIKKRYLEMVVAYNALKVSYDLLYNNVAKKYGEDEAFCLAHGVKKIGSDEDGNSIFAPDPELLGSEEAPIKFEGQGPYTIFYGPNTSLNWENNSWANEFNIAGAERNAEEMGKAHGYRLWFETCRELHLRNIPPIACRVGNVFDDLRVKKAERDGLKPDRKIDFRTKKLYYQDEVKKVDDMDPEMRSAAFDYLEELFFNPGKQQMEEFIYMITPNIDGEIYQYI